MKCRDCGKKLGDMQVSIYKEPLKKYKIKITYDTGDSFHHENDVTGYAHLTFNDLEKAKLALRYIEEHYHFYMLMNKEWNISKKQKEDAEKIASKKPWFIEDKYRFYSTLMLENDEGEMVTESCFWCGYFESLVGADIEIENSDMSFRIRG